jgi:hypothetical protein
MNLGSGITNPTSLRTSFALELQTKPKQDLSKKNLHTHGPIGTIAGGANNAPFLARICFAFCVPGVLVLDLTLLAQTSFIEFGPAVEPLALLAGCNAYPRNKGGLVVLQSYMLLGGGLALHMHKCICIILKYAASRPHTHTIEQCLSRAGRYSRESSKKRGTSSVPMGVVITG